MSRCSTVLSVPTSCSDPPPLGTCSPHWRGQVSLWRNAMPALRIHWCSPLDSGQQKASEKYNTGALVRETSQVKFILAYRPGLLPPTLFTQIVNTVSWMSDKRIALNLVAGISPDEQAYYGDFVAHDGRYERTSEFLEILHRFWKGETPLTHHGAHYRIEQAQLGLPYKDN